MADLSFRATIKPVEVEELIDLFVHRPLAHVIARAAYPTAVTPDQLTMVSMVVGIAAGWSTWSSLTQGRGHLAAGGALLIASAVVDCSDGQLARMRQSSSRFGRMLDGLVDAIVQAAVIPPVIAHLWVEHRAEPRTALLWAALGLVAAVTGSLHTTLYDHFKNVYLVHTQPTRREGNDDPEDVEAHYAGLKSEGLRLADAVRFFLYRRYVPQQRAILGWVDPSVPDRYRDMPAYSLERAARFRLLHRGVMRAWSFYGIGTHIFGLGVAMMADQLAAYVVIRAVAFNLALLALVPAQRRASRRFFTGETPS
jgi:phosphatidylglycerophosphate synthase